MKLQFNIPDVKNQMYNIDLHIITHFVIIISLMRNPC